MDRGGRKALPKVVDLVPQRSADQAAGEAGQGLEALRQAAMECL